MTINIEHIEVRAIMPQKRYLPKCDHRHRPYLSEIILKSDLREGYNEQLFGHCYCYSSNKVLLAGSKPDEGIKADVVGTEISIKPPDAVADPTNLKNRLNIFLLSN